MVILAFFAGAALQSHLASEKKSRTQRRHEEIGTIWSAAVAEWMEASRPLGNYNVVIDCYTEGRFNGHTREQAMRATGRPRPTWEQAVIEYERRNNG